MSMIKKFILIIFLTIFSHQVFSDEVKKMGTHKDWETFIIKSETGKICFTQSKPVLQAPKSDTREARLFISFRPADKIKDEVSITSGYQYNTQNSITAKSGKNKIKFDVKKENFAWIGDTGLERKMVNVMKKGSRIMITGYNQSGSQTIDHYSLMGFTKAYNTAKKSCA